MEPNAVLKYVRSVANRCFIKD